MAQSEKLQKSLPRYSKGGLWTLFLISAFPGHLWTIILVLRDFSWLSERSEVWDAVGVGSYGLVFALIESALIFLVALIIGYALPKRWGEGKRIALLTVVIMITASWAILDQLYFLLSITVPGFIIRALAGPSHPLRILYVLCAILVIPTVVLPLYLVVKSDKALRFVHGLIERLSLLAAFYLVLDFFALVIVITRNM